MLHKQDEICELEDELAKLDDAHAKGEDVDSYRLVTRRYDEEDADCQRRKLMDRIGEVMKEYDELLMREHEILSVKQPSK